jgi:hypothetical protein
MDKPKKPFYATSKFVLIIFSFLFITIIIGNIATGNSEIFSLENILSIVFGSAFFTLCYFLIVVMDVNKSYKHKLEKYNEEVKITINKNQARRKRESRLSELKKDNEIKIVNLKKYFSLTDVDSFEKNLTINQSSIDEKHIQNFVLLGAYLTSKRNSIKQQFDLITNYNPVQEEEFYLKNEHYSENKISIKEMIDNLISQNKYLNTLTVLSNQMLEALLKNDLLSFYKIFNVFDKLGVFNKEWENQLLKTMVSINDNLFEVMEEIRILESSISTSLFELELEISKKLA